MESKLHIFKNRKTKIRGEKIDRNLKHQTK